MNKILFCVFIFGFIPTLIADDLFTRPMSASYYLSPSDITKKTEQANHGDAEAAFRLSQYYALCEFSHEKDLEWLKKASDMGHPTAKYNLAYVYENEAEPRRYKEAMKLYRDIADKGDSSAMDAVARMYEDGHGVSISTNLAIHWYEKAAHKGKVFSMDSAARLLSKEQEMERAYVWAKVAAIRRARSKLKDNDSLLTLVSANLTTNAISKLDERAAQLDKQIPYIENYVLW